MKSYIWTLPTRLFHWLLAIGFAAAFILGENDDLRNWHFTFGALVGGLLVFRLLFGFFGPRYSRFRDFPMGIRHQTAYLKSFLSKENAYAGHNPMASLVMFAIIIVGILTSLSGFILYRLEAGTCVLSLDPELVEGVHKTLAPTFLVLVILHLAGLAAELLFHAKNGTLKSMFSGYKNLQAEPARLSTYHKIFAVLWFLVPFYMAFLANNLPVTAEQENETEAYEEGGQEEEEDE
jgi:cytochrome b